MAVGKLDLVVIDCPDPGALADFYGRLLGLAVTYRSADWVALESATEGTGGGPALAFQRVESFTPPQWPDSAHPQQFHLDINVADLDTAHEQALAVGARVLSPPQGDPPSFRVYADPVGHPFCLVRS